MCYEIVVIEHLYLRVKIFELTGLSFCVLSGTFGSTWGTTPLSSHISGNPKNPAKIAPLKSFQAQVEDQSRSVDGIRETLARRVNCAPYYLYLL